MLFDGYQESADDASSILWSGGGTLVSVMSSKQAQKMGAYLIGKALFRIVLTCFTFDLAVITEALGAAAQRGVDTTVIADRSHTLTGQTKAMVDRFAELAANGVKVLLSRGVTGLSGIQHSKTVLADEHLLVGSCNWTTSSRANQELSLLVHLTEAGMMGYDEKLQFMLSHSSLFDESDERRGKETRDRRYRSASVPPTRDRFATARRFSIARARSANRASDDD